MFGQGTYGAPPRVYESNGAPPGFFPQGAASSAYAAPPPVANGLASELAALAQAVQRIEVRLAVIEARR